MANKNDPKEPGQQVGLIKTIQEHPPAKAGEQVSAAKATEVGDDFHDQLAAYPDSLPKGWLQHLLGLLRGSIKLDYKRDLHFAWHVAGYWMKSMDPHDIRKFNTWGHGNAMAYSNAAASVENHPDDAPAIVEACAQLVQRLQQTRCA